MERWSGKVAIVTGASSGIGAAIAKDLVEHGLKVVGLARRVDRIEELTLTLSNAPGELFAIKCDLQNETEILEAFKWTSENIGPIQILINNAGIMRTSTLINGCTSDWKATIDINILALCICTREAVQIMMSNNLPGHIININSISGHYPIAMPTPNMNVYGATKYAVTALTEMLRQELRYNCTEIRVTSISPGLVRTEFRDTFPNDGTREALDMAPNLEAEDVSGAVLYVLGAKQHIQVHEIIVHPLGEMI